MATVAKAKLSGSTNGRPIKVVATATAGTTLHTAVSGSTAGTYDEVYLWAVNSSTSAVKLTIEAGGVTVPDDLIEVTIPPESGLMPIMPGLPYQGAVVIRAWAGTANVLCVTGYVNAITA